MSAAALTRALAEALRTEVTDLARAAGGDLNDAYVATLAGGRRVFVKTSPDVLPGTYRAEAEDLRWLAEPAALGVPDVLAVVDPEDAAAPVPRLLALELVETGRLDAGGEAELGRGLAAVHAAGAETFGRTHLIRFGALVIPNDPLGTWVAMRKRGHFARFSGITSQARASRIPAGAICGAPLMRTVITDPGS